MSRKRVAADKLTGGTDDGNPQYLNGSLTLSAANTTTTVTLGTPIVRVGPQTGGEAIIMEILKVYAVLPVIDLDAAAATIRNIALQFSTASYGTTATVFDDPRTFAFFQRQVRNAFTAAGTGLLDINEDPMVYDCTDGAGHGILVATDNIFIQGSTTNQTAASGFNFKILYRFKRVSLVEYIGIVQSQQ